MDPRLHGDANMCPIFILNYYIGGMNSDGKNWKLTQKEAIDSIKSGKYAFHVQVNGKAVNVIVAKSRYGNEYIKTEADGDEPNNLLSLMECK